MTLRCDPTTSFRSKEPSYEPVGPRCSFRGQALFLRALAKPGPHSLYDSKFDKHQFHGSTARCAYDMPIWTGCTCSPISGTVKRANAERNRHSHDAFPLAGHFPVLYTLSADPFDGVAQPRSCLRSSGAWRAGSTRGLHYSRFNTAQGSPGPGGRNLHHVQEW